MNCFFYVLFALAELRELVVFAVRALNFLLLMMVALIFTVMVVMCYHVAVMVVDRSRFHWHIQFQMTLFHPGLG